MHLGSLLRIRALRWLVVVLAGVVVLAAGYRVVFPVPPTYVATGAKVLLQPPPLNGENPESHNPYLRFGSALRPTADAIQSIVMSAEQRRRVGQMGLPNDYEVTLGEADPVLEASFRAAAPPLLQVSANASKPEDAVAVVDAVYDLIDEALADTQEAFGAPPEHRVRAAVVSEPVTAQREERDRTRALTAMVTAGVALTLALAVVLESVFGRRSREPAAVRAADTPRPTDEPPVTRRSRWGVAILGVFVVALIALPQRLQLSAFAVTAPMAIGLVAGWVWIHGRLLPDAPGEQGRQNVVPALFVFLTVATASYAIAQLGPLEALEAQGADRRLAQLFMITGIALLAADVVRRPGTLRRIVGIIVAVATFNALVGIMQFLFDVNLLGLGRVFPERAGFPRVAGFAHHPIDFGVFGALAVPLALHFAAFGRTALARRWSGIAAGALALGAAMSITRTALLCLLVGGVVLLASRRGAARWRPVRLAVVAIFVLLAVAPSVRTAANDVVIGAADSPSVESRTSDYAPVLDHVANSPLIGHGYGTFDAETNLVLDNSYLKLLVEVGIVGILAFTTVITLAVLGAWAGRRLVSDPAMRDLGGALAASIMVLAVSAATYDILFFQLGGGSLFLFFGLAAAYWRIVVREGRTPPADERRELSPETERPAVAASHPSP